jgi:hypothetical protein
MENLVIYKEDIKMMCPTEENTRFLEENNLKIKGHISYEVVLKEQKTELGKKMSVTLQGKPGGKLDKVMFAKIHFGKNDQGKEITPFGVIFFEEGGK